MLLPTGCGGVIMSWYRVYFDRSEVVDEAPERFVDAMFHAFTASGWPPEAATFVEKPSGGESAAHGVTYYVSPRGAHLAAAVLERFAAEPCGPPPSEEQVAP